VFDQAIVRERLKKLEEQLTLLRQLQSVPRERFIADPREHVYALHLLQTAIQAIIDIGTHLVSGMNLGRLEAYRDIARLLVQEQIIPADLGPKLEKMIGLRNLIIHEYLRLDLERIYQIVHSELEDLAQFAQHITEFLEKTQGP
jgi:uncharacterized protein YutE (UPF0331/DUF86 family)